MKVTKNLFSVQTPKVAPVPSPQPPVEPAPAVNIQPSIILQPPQGSSEPSATIRLPTGTSNLLIDNTNLINPPPVELPQVAPVLIPQAELVSLPVSPVLQPATPQQALSLENSPTNTNRYFNIIELPVTPSPPPSEQVQPTETDPQVPLSHLVGGNQYPSLHNVPIGIAQSFAPIFVQPNANPAEGADIYNDYINDPYNLTLQIDSSAQDQQQLPQSAPQQNVFQSANYFQFGTGRIPPGSEMLFGEP